MFTYGCRRLMAPGLLIATALSGGPWCAPAFAADDEWLVSWAKPAIDPLSEDPETGAKGIAFGDHAVASGVNSIAFGNYATASGANSIAFGYWSIASGDNSLAMGAYSTARGLNAMALGIGSLASGDNSTGIGNYSHAAGENSVAVGVSSAATGANTTAVGNGSRSLGDNSTAVGVQAVAKGDNTTAIGNHAKATGPNSIAMGVESTASGDNSTALGNHSKATGQNSTAVGILSRATGDDAIALGNQANANGVGSTAIGTQARASGDDSTAIGNQARATGDNSVAIGNGSIATAANTVSFGAPGEERRLTNIADGIAATDAATVHQLNLLRAYVNQRIRAIAERLRELRTAALKIKNGSVAHGPPSSKAAAPARAVRNSAPTKVTGNRSLAAASKLHARAKLVSGKPAIRSALARKRESAISDSRTTTTGSPDQGRPFGNSDPTGAPADGISNTQFQRAMARVNSRIDDVETHANRGIAAAAALAPILMPSQPGRTTASVGSGFYRGEAALSLSVAHRLNLAMPVMVYGSYANGGGDEHLGRVGIAVEF